MSGDKFQLFDDGERDYQGLAKYSESRWEFLNRTARPDFQYVRQVLKYWFDSYDAPLKKKTDLVKNFRSRDDKEHISAFFELYLYHLFIAQGFKVEVEPAAQDEMLWEKGNPDFLITSSNNQKILVEARGIFPDRWFGSSKKQEKLVIDYVNEKLYSPNFFIQIHIDQAPQGNPPYKLIKRHIEETLEQLEYKKILEGEDLSFENFPKSRWQHETWNIEFKFIPKKPEARGNKDSQPIGSLFYEFGSVDTTSYLKSAINQKSNKYGELKLPFLLALNIFDSFYSKDALFEALFGEEQITFDFESRTTHSSRKPTGEWFSQNGFQKKRMSGICVFKKLSPEAIHRVSPELWHHPSSNYPIDENIFALNQQIPNLVTRRYELKDGKHPKDLLQIDENQMPQ